MYNQLAAAQDVAFARPSFREELEGRKKRLTEELTRVDSALDALNQNPSVAEVVEAVLGARY